MASLTKEACSSSCKILQTKKLLKCPAGPTFEASFMEQEHLLHFPVATPCCLLRCLGCIIWQINSCHSQASCRPNMGQQGNTLVPSPTSHSLQISYIPITDISALMSPPELALNMLTVGQSRDEARQHAATWLHCSQQPLSPIHASWQNGKETYQPICYPANAGRILPLHSPKPTLNPSPWQYPLSVTVSPSSR